MISSFLSWWVGRVIERMQFPHQADGGSIISDSVLKMFRRGCEMGLRGYPYETFIKETQSLPWNLRAFFNEGHAMGSAGHAACSLRKRYPEKIMTSKNYEIMRFVGYGFWNGVAVTYHVPRISEATSSWKEVPTFPKYHLLMANGYGFALVLFKGRFDQQLKKQLLKIEDARRRDAVFHGIGRVLWFLYLSNFHALKNILEEHDEVTEPLAIGLGLAIAFTQVATPEKILRALESFPEPQYIHLLRGVGIALQVHAQNDPECKRNIEQSINGELREWYEGAWQASNDAGNGEEWYPRYHELTKRFSERIVSV